MTEPSIVSSIDALIALGSVEPRCVVGNEPFSRSHGHEACKQTAIWAARTHDGMGDTPTGRCPTVLLVCDYHLAKMRDAAVHNLAHAHSQGARIRCSTCSTWTTTVDQLLWGIERISP